MSVGDDCNVFNATMQIPKVQNIYVSIQFVLVYLRLYTKHWGRDIKRRSITLQNLVG